MRAFVLTVLGATLLAVAPASGAERCHTTGPGQFVDAIHYCVSSVLPPQSGNSYGPENLADGDTRTAWCEGVKGQGIGETITLRISRSASFSRLLIGNGYGKSQKSYESNSRPRLVEITTDRTAPTTVELFDQNGILPVPLMASEPYAWVRVKILSVYPGTKYADTCMDFIVPDFEYDEMLLQQQQLPATTGAAGQPSITPPPAPQTDQADACLRSGAAVFGTLERQPTDAGIPAFRLRFGQSVCIELASGETVDTEAVRLLPFLPDERDALEAVSEGSAVRVSGQFARTEGRGSGGIVILAPRLEPF